VRIAFGLPRKRSYLELIDARTDARPERRRKSQSYYLPGPCNHRPRRSPQIAGKLAANVGDDYLTIDAYALILALLPADIMRARV